MPYIVTRLSLARSADMHAFEVNSCAASVAQICSFSLDYISASPICNLVLV